MKYVIFDLDGTLSCTEKFMIPAIQDAMKICGMPIRNSDEIKITIGETIETTNRKFFGVEKCEEATRFWECVEEQQHNVYADKMCTYEGISEMLDELHQRGYQTAVCSNAEMDYIDEVLIKLNLMKKIDKIRPIILGKNKIESLKVFLETEKPEFAIMVGDRNYDIEAAKINNILSIGCLYGCGTRYELADADYLVETPIKILSVIEKIEIDLKNTLHITSYNVL